MSSFFSGTRVLMTGAGGFIGSSLAKELLRRGASLTAFARKSSNLWRLDDHLSEIEWAYPDLDDYDEILSHMKRVRPDFIYHLATYYSVDNNVDISRIIDTNIKAGAFLVKAAAEIDTLKLLINVGTCAEYGDIKDDAGEDSKLAPNTIYASTKAANTLILHQMAGDLNVPLATLRLYNLFGEYEDAKRIVPCVILSLLNDKDVKLTGCEQAKDYSYIGDFVGAFTHAAKNHRSAAGEIFNIGSGSTIKMRQLVEGIAANLPSSKGEINFGSLPYRENEMWYQSTSIAKAKKCLDWQPEVSLQEGIKKTVDWYRENHHRYYK